MKKVSLILILFIMTILPCAAKNQSDKNIESKSNNSKVFVYHIPDDSDSENAQPSSADDNPMQVQELPANGVITDDITIDTSEEAQNLADNNDEEDEENNDSISLLENYQIDDMYSDVLKGYAEYNEEEENSITLDNADESISTIKIKKPSKVETTDFSNLSITPQKGNYFSYTAPEYSITPVSNKKYKQFGKFKAGAVYGQEIFYAELEQSSGIFSSYDFNNKFSVSTSYLKTINSTNNDYNDNFYFSPSYKINQYLTVSESLSADISKERQKADVSLSINPFGNKDDDRLLFIFGASQTRYNDGRTPKNKFSFTTKIKL
mgnify:FL=1